MRGGRLGYQRLGGGVRRVKGKRLMEADTVRWWIVDRMGFGGGVEEVTLITRPCRKIRTTGLDVPTNQSQLIFGQSVLCHLSFGRSSFCKDA